MQELELAMNLALYGLLRSLGNQYIVGSLSWRSLTEAVVVVVVVVVIGVYVLKTANIKRKRNLGLKSQPNDWSKSISFTTMPRRLLQEMLT